MVGHNTSQSLIFRDAGVVGPYATVYSLDQMNVLNEYLEHFQRLDSHFVEITIEWKTFHTVLNIVVTMIVKLFVHKCLLREGLKLFICTWSVDEREVKCNTRRASHKDGRATSFLLPARDSCPCDQERHGRMLYT